MRKIIIFMFLSNNIIAVSVVYNFRVAQITRQPIARSGERKPNMLIGLVLDQYQQQYSGIKQNYLSGLGAFLHLQEPWYVRADFAVASIRQWANHVTTYKKFETDDVLLAFGRHFKPYDKLDVTVSGFLGIPTHKMNLLDPINFGFAQVGTGIQVDSNYTFNKKTACFLGGRYVYFIPRPEYDGLCKKYKITAGNLIDLLFALKTDSEHHGFEFGYTARFQFGAASKPYLREINQETDYIRNSVYAVYKYKFMIRHIPNRLLFDITYGADTQSKFFNSKHVITAWASYNINF